MIRAWSPAKLLERPAVCVGAAEWSESFGAERSDPSGSSVTGSEFASSDASSSSTALDARPSSDSLGDAGRGVSECRLVAASGVPVVPSGALAPRPPTEALRWPSDSMAIGSGAAAAWRSAEGSERERRMTGPSSDRERERTSSSSPWHSPSEPSPCDSTPLRPPVRPGSGRIAPNCRLPCGRPWGGDGFKPTAEREEVRLAAAADRVASCSAIISICERSAISSSACMRIDAERKVLEPGAPDSASLEASPSSGWSSSDQLRS